MLAFLARVGLSERWGVQPEFKMRSFEENEQEMRAFLIRVQLPERGESEAGAQNEQF